MKKSTFVIILVAIVIAFAGVWAFGGKATPDTTDTSGSASTTTASNVALPGGHCGGNMMNPYVCSAGYHCAPSAGSHLPFGDVGGTCVADGTPLPTSASTTIRGTVICLPHKDTSGPQTMECAYGIKSDAGGNYALDLSAAPQSAQDVPMNTHLSMTGLVTPVDALNTDRWQKYDIKGILQVKSYEELDVKNVPVNSSTTIGLNQTIKVQGTTLKVRAVTEDSRCASDVQCVWAGRVRVALAIASSTSTSMPELEPGTTITAGNLAITLDKVAPYPISTHKIADSEYRFTFTIKSR